MLAVRCLLICTTAIRQSTVAYRRRGAGVRKFTVLVCLISALSLGTSAVAATVTATQGQVLVNRGNGYQRVVGSTQAGTGATVVANPGGSAQVVYSDGCVVTVEPGSVYTIAPQSP